jgi:hypothetical protein
MKEKDRNGKSELSDFLRYKKGEMTDRERNAFERELQKDPFSAEADEGFSGISTDTVKEDMSRLERELKTRVSKKRRYIYYRIAASVAVLMVISSVFIIMQRKDQTKEIGEVITKQAPLNIPESKAITQPEIEVRKDKNAVPGERAARKTESVNESEKIELATQIDDKRDRAVEKKSEPVAVPVNNATALIIPKENQAAEPAVAEDLAFAQVAPADTLNEVVFVGYGVARNAKAAGAEAYKSVNKETGYTPPLPAEGKTSFDKYIEENMKTPGSLPAGEKAVVVISFIVKSSGIIDTIKVVRSPGNEFSDEAKRLIMEGPPWNPAISNGEKIDEEVKVRIVFK